MSITLHDTVTVTATDTDGLQVVDIFVDMVGHDRETVYTSTGAGESGGAGAFDARFTDTARVAVTDGFDYTFGRIGGWRSATMTIVVHAIDAAGELTITSQAYTVDDPAALAISAMAPTPGLPPGTAGAFSSSLAVAKQTPITFTVRGAETVFVFLRYTNSSTREVVYNGSSFAPGFAIHSTETDADVDMLFSILPTGGWRGSIDCLAIVAFDDMGGFINVGDA